MSLAQSINLVRKGSVSYKKSDLESTTILKGYRIRTGATQNSIFIHTP